MATEEKQTTAQDTGASDLEFDLVSEMHELLKANAALEQYCEDADEAGDEEAKECFEGILDNNREHLGKLRQLLHRTMQKAA
jgi:rubrerythrin